MIVKCLHNCKLETHIYMSKYIYMHVSSLSLPYFRLCRMDLPLSMRLSGIYFSIHIKNIWYWIYLNLKRIIDDYENLKQYTDSEKGTGNPNSIRSVLAPPSSRARTTSRLTNRDRNITIPPALVDDGAPIKSMEDVASRKRNALIQNTSKKSRVRLNCNEGVSLTADTAINDKRREIPKCGRLTRSTSRRTVPRFICHF